MSDPLCNSEANKECMRECLEEGRKKGMKSFKSGESNPLAEQAKQCKQDCNIKHCDVVELSALKNLIRAYESNNGRNIAMRRAFNETLGKTL